MEPLLTSKEAAALLKVHPKVLERWAKAGEIPALKVGQSAKVSGPWDSN